MLVFCRPHSEHFVAAFCPSPPPDSHQFGRENTLSRAVVGTSSRKGAVVSSRFQGTAPGQSHGAGGVYTNSMVKSGGDSGKCFMWQGEMLLWGVSAKCTDPSEMTPPRSLGALRSCP